MTRTNPSLCTTAMANIYREMALCQALATQVIFISFAFIRSIALSNSKSQLFTQIQGAVPHSPIHSFIHFFIGDKLAPYFLLLFIYYVTSVVFRVLTKDVFLTCIISLF